MQLKESNTFKRNQIVKKYPFPADPKLVEWIGDKMIYMKQFTWTIPFLCFLTGYYSMRFIYHTNEIETPSLIGMQLPDAFAMLSAHNLYPRILQEREDSDLPSGTILSQTPAPKTQIKPQQSVFLIISKPAPLPRAPLCINASKKTITTQTQARKIRAKLYQLPSIYPLDHAFAQYPGANQIVNDSMIIYVSSGTRKPVILPNFKDLTVQEAKGHLAAQPITIQTTHTHPVHSDPSRPPHDCSSCIILDQRPLPGSIIGLDESKPISLSLKVSYQW